MFKKLCLSLIFATVPIALSNQQTNTIIDITNNIDHINKEKTAILVEMKKTIFIGQKAIEHQKTVLDDNYELLAAQVTAVLNTIITSEEFNSSLNEATDYQAIMIAHNGIHCNDITYESQNYSLIEKINRELTAVFPSLDQHTELLFNIFYVTIANFSGCKMLIEKLDLQLNDLQEKLLTFEASDNTIDE